MKRYLSLLLLVLVFGTVKARAEEISLVKDRLSIPVEYMKCEVDKDCVSVAEVCGRGWRALNTKHAEIANQKVSGRDMAISCARPAYQQPNVRCLTGICTIVPDADMCMLKYTSGMCATRCNIGHPYLLCQHECQEGAPCD